ncbi:hypothetical protein EDB80DRAFT_887409 [Ilyonectria destructans]|nr:hypothetical protein EDB80DRAFT_887409 [Ilyonectria destructans]
MRSHLTTGILLSGLAGGGSSHHVSVPECATECSRDLMGHHGMSNMNTLCNDIALFLCLTNSCKSQTYGPALAYSISECSSLGATISNLHPVELHHFESHQRQPTSIAPRSEAGMLSFADQFTLSVDCTAGSDGVLTLSLPSSGSSPTSQPLPYGASPASNSPGAAPGPSSGLGTSSGSPYPPTGPQPAVTGPQSPVTGPQLPTGPQYPPQDQPGLGVMPPGLPSASSPNQGSGKGALPLNTDSNGFNPAEEDCDDDGSSNSSSGGQPWPAPISAPANPAGGAQSVDQSSPNIQPLPVPGSLGPSNPGGASGVINNGPSGGLQGPFGDAGSNNGEYPSTGTNQSPSTGVNQGGTGGSPSSGLGDGNRLPTSGQGSSGPAQPLPQPASQPPAQDPGSSGPADQSGTYPAGQGQSQTDEDCDDDPPGSPDSGAPAPSPLTPPPTPAGRRSLHVLLVLLWEMKTTADVPALEMDRKTVNHQLPQHLRAHGLLLCPPAFRFLCPSRCPSQHQMTQDVQEMLEILPAWVLAHQLLDQPPPTAMVSILTPPRVTETQEAVLKLLRMLRYLDQDLLDTVPSLILAKVVSRTPVLRRRRPLPCLLFHPHHFNLLHHLRYLRLIHPSPLVMGLSPILYPLPRLPHQAFQVAPTASMTELALRPIPPNPLLPNPNLLPSFRNLRLHLLLQLLLSFLQLSPSLHQHLQLSCLLRLSCLLQPNFLPQSRSLNPHLQLLFSFLLQFPSLHLLLQLSFHPQLPSLNHHPHLLHLGIAPQKEMEMVNLAQPQIQVVLPREPIRLQFYQLHQMRLHATRIFLHPRKGTLRLRLMMVLPTHATVIPRTVTTLIQVQVPMWCLHRLKHFLPHTADLLQEKIRLLQVLTAPDLHLYHHQTVRSQARGQGPVSPPSGPLTSDAPDSPSRPAEEDCDEGEVKRDVLGSEYHEDVTAEHRIWPIRRPSQPNDSTRASQAPVVTEAPMPGGGSSPTAVFAPGKVGFNEGTLMTL